MGQCGKQEEDWRQGDQMASAIIKARDEDGLNRGAVMRK